VAALCSTAASRGRRWEAGAHEPGRGRAERRAQVFCGNAAKSIAVWEPPAAEMQDKVVLNGHSGWVRALAVDGRWLFRCAGCVRTARCCS
jgi:hypothetical protein